MVTKRQLRANRRNARSSTGPKTEAGKTNSRMNSYVHGVCSKISHMSNEDIKLFDDLREGLVEQFGPKYPTEFDLIDKLAMSYFRDFQLANSVAIMMDVLPLLEHKLPFVSPVDPEVKIKKKRLDLSTRYLTLDDQQKVMKLQSIVNAETRKLLKDLRSEIEANDRTEAEFIAEEIAEAPSEKRPEPEAPGNDNAATSTPSDPLPRGQASPQAE